MLPERLEVGDLYGGSRVKEGVAAMLAGVGAHYIAHVAAASAASQQGHAAAAVGGDTSGNSSCTPAAGSMEVDEQLQPSPSPSSMSLHAEQGRGLPGTHKQQQ